VAAGGGVFLLGNFSGGGVVGGGPQQTVVIAKQAIPARHQITDADLDTTKVTGSFVNVYSRPSDVRGLVAQIQLARGVVITSDMLAKDASLIALGAAPAYLPLASGYVALTIPTGEQQGVAGHITLGDYVTVIASGSGSLFAPPKGGQQAQLVSKTVFTNLRIIGLGPASSSISSANGGNASSGSAGPVTGVTSSLTVELTQCDAEYLTWFLNNMSVKYSLESFHDYLQQPPNAPDPTCPTVLAAQGVSAKEVDLRYHFSRL
jgi:Flp pilus assembly protein CpaB